jgi:hypothetical protein
VTATRRAGLAALAVGLITAALLHGGGAPPVFDGIIVPPEPYRWESPPPNLKAGNKPPLSGEATLPVVNGQVAGGGVQTGDSQVIIFFGPGTFKAPSGASSVKCTIQPDANPPPAPSGVDMRGNVYRIGCVGQPGGSAVTVTSTYHLTLRFPPGAFKEIQYQDGTSWRALTTLRAPGGDPYASVNAPGFGEYAATAPTGAASGGDSLFSVLGRYVEFYGILAFVILFGVIAIVQEIRRRQKQAPSPTLPRKRGRERQKKPRP